MTFALGTATGRIQIDYDGSGVDKAEKDIDGLVGKNKDAQAGLNKLGNTAGIAGLAIAGGLAAGVNAAANFEKGLSAIQAVSGATAKEMDLVRDKALQLGKETAFSAGESALAMEELIKAGLSVEDVINGVADATVNLAAAGEVDLKEAATIASNSMNQFGLAAEDMPNVADKIAGAANASAIDVKDFGYSISQAGAVANLAGVSFDDTATAIALLGNAGIKGSDAGTSLKSMLMRLQPTTKAAYEEMKKLGLISMDANKALEVLAQNGIKGVKAEDAEKELGKLAAAMTESEVGSAKAESWLLKTGLQTGFLRNQFYKANGETKSFANIAQELGDAMEGLDKRQQQQALTTLFGADAIRAAAIIAKDGKKGFEDMGKSMGKVTAADVAKTRMDNLKGSIEEMMGSLETLAIALGTILLPPLRKIVDAVTGLLNKFLNLDEGTQKVIVAVLAAVGALLLIFAAVVKVIMFISSLKTALVALRGTMIATWAAALGPIALVIAAVAAVIAIIVLLWKKNDAFRNAVIAAWNTIKAAFWAVVNWFKTTIIPAITGAWDAIVGAVTAGINAVKSVISAIMKAIVGIWKAYWKIFGPLVKAIWRFITSIIKLGWTIIKGLFILYFRLLKAIFSRLWNTMVAIVKAVWNTIKAVVKTSIDSVRWILAKIWDLIGDKVKAVWGGIVRVVKEHIDNVVKAAGELKDRVLGFFKDAGSWLYDKGKAIIQGLVDGIASMIDAVSDKVEKVTGVIGKFLPGSPVKEGPLTVLNRGYAGKQIVKMVVDGIETNLRYAADASRTMGGELYAGIPASLGSAPALVPAVAGARNVTNNFNINNPEPERSSVSVGRALRSRVDEEGWGK